MGNLQAALDAPTALNVTVQATRRREVRRSSRPREYLTEREIEKLSPRLQRSLYSSAQVCGQRTPLGHPQNIWVPSRSIQTIPSYAQWGSSPTSCTCYRRTLARPPPLLRTIQVCPKERSAGG